MNADNIVVTLLFSSLRLVILDASDAFDASDTREGERDTARRVNYGSFTSEHDGLFVHREHETKNGNGEPSRGRELRHG
jgi:hypothetical protein